MRIKVEDIFEKAKNAKRESKHIEFKEKFDPASNEDWCEIVKDIVALANSGGGCILIGVKNNGMPSGVDLSAVERLDPAQITDKIAKYTGEQFSDFEIKEFNKKGYKVIALLIGKTSYPMVFTRPGTYQVEQGKQKTAFAKGTIYFRHGAKSEPGNSRDLEIFFTRKLNEVKKDWFKGIRKVVNAPQGYKIVALPSEAKIRLVDDPKAPAYRKITSDEFYPHRRKEVINEINKKLHLKKKFNQYDVQAIRKVYEIDKKSTFFYKSKFGPPQYSPNFVEWIVNQYNKNHNFFEETRRKFKELQKQKEVKKC